MNTRVTRSSLASAFACVSWVLSLGVMVFYCFWKMVASNDGSYKTILQQQGFWILPILLIPPVIAGLAYAVTVRQKPRSRKWLWINAILLWVYCVVCASVGTCQLT